MAAPQFALSEFASDPTGFMDALLAGIRDMSPGDKFGKLPCPEASISFLSCRLACLFWSTFGQGDGRLVSLVGIVRISSRQNDAPLGITTPG